MSEEDYQIGVHDIDTTGSITDEENVIEFEFEPEAVFKRLADDVYESAEAGIREPLMNSITAVRRAFGNNLDEGVIRFTVKRGEQTTIRIRDNGIGITKGVLNEILTVVGRSSVRDDGNLTGQYGMGFLASYKLVGPDGGFMMTTNPRESEEGPYSGLFKPGTFEPNTEGHLPQMLDEDEYGTVFEFHTKRGIGADDIFRWVKKHARWSPVPVIYQELDENGNEIMNEDFHTSELSDRYDDAPYVSFENEFFEIAASPEATGETVLISSPMEIKNVDVASMNLPWQTDIRLKYENGVVIDGEHRGLAPVNKSEYESMDEKRKERYIPKSRLHSTEITLPSPIGTREMLERNDDFLEYANEKIIEKFRNVLSDAVEEFNPSNQKVTSLGDKKRNALFYFSQLFQNSEYIKFLDRMPRSKRGGDSRRDKISSKLNHILSKDLDSSDEIVKFIDIMGRKVSVFKDGNKERMYIHNAIETDANVQQTYMCVSRGTWKYDALMKSDYNGRVVSVRKSDMYEPLSEQFGWTPLKNITVDSAQSKLGLSESEIEEIRGKTAESVEDEMVKVYEGRNSTKYAAKEIKENFSLASGVLVLFPRGYDKNLTDNKWLSGNGVAIASCTKKVKEYLIDNEYVMTYEDYINWSLQTVVDTENGTMSEAGFINEDDKSVLYLKENVNPVLQESSTIGTIKQGLEKTESYINKSTVLGVVSKERFKHVENSDRLSDDFTLDRQDFLVLSESLRYSLSNRNQYEEETIDTSEVDAYLRSSMADEVYESQVSKTVENMFDGVNKDMISLVTSINESYDIGGLNMLDVGQASLPVHKTKDGRMTIIQIYDNYDADDVVLNILSSDAIGYFETTEFLERAAENIGGMNFYDGMIPSGRHSGDKIYVPVSQNDFEQIENLVKSGTSVIAGASPKTIKRQRNAINTRLGGNNRRSFNQQNSLPASVTTADVRMIYAQVMLNEWSRSDISELVDNLSFPDTKVLVDALQPLHDDGGSPP